MLVKVFEVEYSWFGRPTKYIYLGEREMKMIPNKGDYVKGKDLWYVEQVTVVLDVEAQNPDNDYAKIYVRKAWTE